MTPDAIRKIAAAYGLDVVSIGERQSGYRNHSFRITERNGSLFNLVVYKRETAIVSRIKNGDAVSAFVAAGNQPARVPIAPGIIRLSGPTATRYAALYNYLPGATIPWEGYTHNHLVLLGDTMSAMHRRLAAAPASISKRLPRVSNELLGISRRMEAYLKDPGVQRAAHRQLAITISPTIARRFRAVLDASSHQAPGQPLHMDFVRSNILFEQTSAGPIVTGILDFEKTAFGPPIIDIARTLSFLLIDSRYKTARHVSKYFLASGYNKRGPATLRRITVTAGDRSFNLLDELMNCFLLYDLYKFMRHNPYESLHENHHYLRTVAYLSSRGLVHKANRFAPSLF